VTRIDLDELERKARAATPGPWQTTSAKGTGADERIETTVETEEMHQIADAYDGTRWTDAMCEANAKHIAANSPPVTLAPIARIRELEEAVDDALNSGIYLAFTDDGIERRAWLRELLEKGAVLA
jgi:hypothetical protein